jgi:hypothetical protein
MNPMSVPDPKDYYTPPARVGRKNGPHPKGFLPPAAVRGAGRKKGTPNRLTKTIKEMVINPLILQTARRIWRVSITEKGRVPALTAFGSLSLYGCSLLPWLARGSWYSRILGLAQT